MNKVKCEQCGEEYDISESYTCPKCKIINIPKEEK